MKRKLISVVGGALLCLAALPWTDVGASAAPPLASPATEAPDRTPASRRAVPVRTAAPAAGDALVRLIDVGAVEAEGVSPDALRLALSAVSCGIASGDLEAPPTLTLIDYSRPSTDRRLWVFDLTTGALLFNELVAHGRNTGENFATHFSDTLNSRQSSLGMFVTDETYVGSNGYSLRLNGLEPGFNGRARERAIVMHGAPYVDPGLAATQGRIGRSWGCPALREAVARKVIDTIRGGGVVFAYYPDPAWLESSRFLNGCNRTPALATH